MVPKIVIGKSFLQSRKLLDVGSIWASFTDQGYILVKIKDKTGMTASNNFCTAETVQGKDKIIDIYSLHEVEVQR